MLFQTLKRILMLMQQSACYNVLRDRLVSTSRFRQSIVANSSHDDEENLSENTEVFVTRVLEVRGLHCSAVWETIRAESLETITFAVARHETKEEELPTREKGVDRREWLGYESKEHEMSVRAKYQAEKRQQGSGVKIEEIKDGYNDFSSMPAQDVKDFESNTGKAPKVVRRAETVSARSGSSADSSWANSSPTFAV